MPYIAYDLDALERAQHVARAATITDDASVAGNARMWAYCWKYKTNLVTAAHLAGFYGADRVGPSLVAFGFLEALPDGSFRVLGAERYLRISAARSKGGRASKGNLKRGAISPADAEKSRESAGEEPEKPPGSVPALTSSIEHLASKEATTTYVDAAPEPAPPKPPVEPPHKPNPDSPALAFWCWAQDGREVAGLVREPPPHPRKLGAWYSEALGKLGGDEERLKEAAFRFGEDQFWKSKGLPFAGFISQWERYAPTRAATSR